MYWRSPSYNATRFVMTVRLWLVSSTLVSIREHLGCSVRFEPRLAPDAHQTGGLSSGRLVAWWGQQGLRTARGCVASDRVDATTGAHRAPVRDNVLEQGQSTGRQCASPSSPCPTLFFVLKTCCCMVPFVSASRIVHLSWCRCASGERAERDGRPLFVDVLPGHVQPGTKSHPSSLEAPQLLARSIGRPSLVCSTDTTANLSSQTVMCEPHAPQMLCR